MPQSWNPSPAQKTLDPSSFQFSSDFLCDVLNSAFQRYSNILDVDKQAVKDESLDVLNRLRVTVENKSCSENHYPSVNSDESCELWILLTCAVYWHTIQQHVFSQSRRCIVKAVVHSLQSVINTSNYATLLLHICGNICLYTLIFWNVWEYTSL